ncbi:MAG TPA: MarR family transcriptional regulator [Jatrophihabitans sp.]|jgi:DNA-binding MarR family transcriptional regulator
MGRIQDDTADLADVIDRLTMWLRRQVPTAVSSSTITTLDSLAANGPSRISDLAEREAISQPGMTSLVNRLEAAGQAERVSDPTDGRAALVRITDAGLALLTQRHAARALVLGRELDRLDDTERAALTAAVPALRRLITMRESASL